MVKKVIKYKDFDDVERESEFLFHFKQSELAEMELSSNGGLDALIKKIIAEKDTAKLVAMFKEVILKSYGEKSLDGNRFMKSPELSRAFEESNAYDVLFMELLSDSTKAAEFFNGLVEGAKS